MVSSTTPRFGPRWPPTEFGLAWERMLTSSSRTSCARRGRSFSSSALMSAGELILSSNRMAETQIGEQLTPEFKIVARLHRYHPRRRVAQFAEQAWVRSEERRVGKE